MAARRRKGHRPARAGPLAELIAFGGLPGTGKSTLAQKLAARHSATYVRVDEIEHALAGSARNGEDFGPAGYVAACAVARSNLSLGNRVIADSVNPVPASRQGWRNVAREAGCPIAEIEIICSDKAEHKRRVESRVAEIEGFALPTWPSVLAHEYVPRTDQRLVIDTAELDPDRALAQIEQLLGRLVR